MRNLIVTDFKRILKDKLLIVIGIIAAVFAVMTPGLYALIFSALGTDFGDISGLVSAKSFFFQSFNLSGTITLITPILFMIIVCKDFSYGTIRNKIISGKSRSQIFISMLITTTVTIFAIVLIHAILTLLVSLIFFDYQAEAFAFSDILYALLSLLIEAIIFIFLGAFISLLVVLMKNVGLAIVIFFATEFVFELIGMISSVATIFIDKAESEILYYIMEFFTRCNLFATTEIGSGTSYEVWIVLGITVPALLFAALSIFLGLKIFNKKDIK